MTRFLTALVVAGLCAFASPSWAAKLAPPFDVDAIRAKVGAEDKKPFTCKAPPAALIDLQMHSFYQKGDETHSIVDPKAHAAYKKASKPASKFEIGLGGMANRYVRSNPPRADIAQCALDWLAAWAESGALMGDVNKNGENTRKWLLGSISSDWMQIRGEPALSAAKRQVVVNWIRQVAEAVRADYSRDVDLGSRNNNHLYWAAWGVGSAGLAIDDRDMFNWAVQKTKTGIGYIEQDGTLPLEIARGRRAYLYHLFAAMPLFMMANAAEKNGIDLFSENNQALKRLAKLNLRNLDNGADFERLTDETQDMDHAVSPSNLGWVEIYRQRYTDTAADDTLQKFRPMKQSRFGGNITLLYAQMNVKQAEKKQAAASLNN